MLSEKFFANGDDENSTDSVTALLVEQDYTTVAHHVQTAREQAASSGKNEIAGLLAAIYQICLICQQQQEEQAGYYQAYEEAMQREAALKQQLITLLQLLAQRDTAVSLPHPFSSPTTTEDGRSPSLWQRVQTLFTDKPQPKPELPPQPNGVSLTAPTPAPTPAEPPSPIEEDGPRPVLTIYCLGAFRIYKNGRLLDDWSSLKAKSVFKYMLQHRERMLHIEEMMTAFWPDDPPKVARRNLYQAVYMLRQALQSDPEDDVDYVINGDGRYQINPDLPIWIDSDAFQQHYAAGQKLEAAGHIAVAMQQYEAADSLYEGDYLAEDRYEEWALIQRENLKLAYLDILDRLSEHYWQQNNDALCILACRKILAQDNCREDAHRRLMRVFMRRGQRHLALRQYHRCTEALQAELEVDPMPATAELYQSILENEF